MYEEFYGLSMRPFGKTPDPAFLFESRQHAEAMARLELAVEERELALLTGEIGCGKTLLSRTLVDRLGEEYVPILLVNPRLAPGQLLRQVASRLGVEDVPRDKSELYEKISDRLYALDEEDKCAVLLIDEAQLVPSKQTFDELRLLTNFQLDDRNLLAVVLLAQPEIERRIDRHPAYEPLRQRIGVRFHLGPLSEEEAKKYIEHRLEVAGAKGSVLSAEAIAAIGRLSGGIPRKINNLAANTLLEGFGREERPIGAAVVEDVARELRMKPKDGED
ncbi:MAG: AAA family ATPase [Bdellovibrionota bacterium]